MLTELGQHFRAAPSPEKGHGEYRKAPFCGPPSYQQGRPAQDREQQVTRGLLKAIGVLAVSMVMSDGVLTPAQSVLGAVRGLSVVKQDISNAAVVGTSCGILVLLFAIQPSGNQQADDGFRANRQLFTFGSA